MKCLSVALFLFFTFVASVCAQSVCKWYDPLQASYPVLQGQGWTSELAHTYTRLPMRSEAKVRKEVWNLSLNSAGLYIDFETNSPTVQVRYKTTSTNYSLPHMPATGVSGVSLYQYTNSVFGYCFGSYSFSDTIQYRYDHLSKTVHNYRLYLPLYNGVASMKIGVDSCANFRFLPKSKQKPIVVYGTSIAQGACASRPGMAWSNILQRQLQCPVINLGFSGNGKLEKSVLDLLGELDARLFVIDCLPNLDQFTAAQATDSVVAAVHLLRKKSDAPILLVDHAGYSNAPTNASQYELYTMLNRAQKLAFDRLEAEHVGKLYYLSHKKIAFPADAWVDYVHPSDWGMHCQAKALEHKIKSILKK